MKIFCIGLMLMVSFMANAQHKMWLCDVSGPTAKSPEISIELCDDTGSVQIDDDRFRMSDTLYFLVTSLNNGASIFRKNKLRVRMIDGFSMKQDNHDAKCTLHAVVCDNRNKPQSLILAVAREPFDVTRSISMLLYTHQEQSLHIPEWLWPLYPQHKDLFHKGLHFYEREDYEQAFTLWQHFLGVEVPHYSFSDTLMGLLGNALLLDFSNIAGEAEVLEQGMRQLPSLELLEQYYLLKDNVEHVRSYGAMLFNDTIELPPTQFRDRVKSTYKLLLQRIEKNYQSEKKLFIQEAMQLFREGDYSSYQFSLYLDLLCRMMLCPDLEQGTLALRKPSIELTAYYSDSQRILREMEWEKDFNITLNVLGLNLAKGRLFSTAVMENLRHQQGSQPQPYYEMVVMIQAMLDGDNDLAAEFAQRALFSVSDSLLIESIGFINLLVSTVSTHDTMFYSGLNDGLKWEKNGYAEGAEKQYRKLERNGFGGALLWYLQGRTRLSQDDKYGAQVFLQLAIHEQHDDFLIRYHYIDLLMAERGDEVALVAVDSALHYHPVWAFYRQKAEVLYRIGMKNEALSLLNEQCIALNSFDYGQYILAGDIYSDRDDVVKARELYMKAGALQPDSELYRKRLDALVIVDKVAEEVVDDATANID